MSDQIDRLQLGKDLANATRTAEQSLRTSEKSLCASTEAAKSSADNTLKLDQIMRSVEQLKKKVDHINGVDEKLAAQGFFAGTAEQNRRIMSFLRWISRYPKITLAIITIIAAAILGESSVDLAHHFNQGFFK